MTIRTFLARPALALAVLFAGGAVAQIPGWDSRWPAPQKVFAGCDPAQLREFREQSAILAKTPNDIDALVNRGVACLRLTRTSNFGDTLLWLAAKDLEKAIKIDPRDFAAWHNYGEVNFKSGDMWMINDHSNARRAVDAYNHAVALNPKSARSYMGRGWAYYRMNDAVHAKADFQKALQLDPSLRDDLYKEVGNIDEGRRQEGAARGTIDQLGSYYVDKFSNTEAACKKAICLWKQGECRCSNALNPGPR